MREPGVKVYEDLLQGSDEWLAARCGIVTASVIGQLITPATIRPAKNDTARGLTAHLVGERITGFVEPTFTSFDMERGNHDEPLARDLYSELHAPVAEVGFITRTTDDGFTLGYSPDGLVGDDGLIEVKSRKQKTQVSTILADQPPAANMAQLQAGLWVTGRKWIDYLSYCGGMPMYVKRVFPDWRWFEAIESSLILFEQTAADMLATYQARTEGLEPTERVDFYGDVELKL